MCFLTSCAQLFSFNAGSIFINIPFIHHRDKLMCLEAVQSKADQEIQLAPCSKSAALQHFSFFKADGKRLKKNSRQEISEEQ